jgi:hypothetical protein
MINLARQKFGRWTVLEFSDITKNKYYWKCICDCGSVKRVASNSLKNGATKSCGCWKEERQLRHGQAKFGLTTKTYKAWQDMRHRCYNSNDTAYKNYGGRGIKVCDRWLKFENFYADVGDIPKNMTLDRKDNDGDYEPGNWRLATQEEQCSNKRDNHWVEYKSERKTIAQWARSLNINYGTLKSRLIRYGWSEERALTTPVRGVSKDE